MPDVRGRVSARQALTAAELRSQDGAAADASQEEMLGGRATPSGVATIAPGRVGPSVVRGSGRTRFDSAA
jgi:hypothetical protein